MYIRLWANWAKVRFRPNRKPATLTDRGGCLEFAQPQIHMEVDMKGRILLALAIGGAITSSALAKEKPEETTKRMTDATAVVADAKTMGISKSLFEKSHCAIIIPGMKKGGFLVAGQYGKGFVSCKNKSGKFSTLSAVKMEGGSFGLQAGGSATDILMLVMNDKGVEHLTKSKFTLGGEASVAAGPVGADTSAQTDATMAAEVLSWSKSRGVFGGISLKGSTLRGDEEAEANLYPAKHTAEELHIKQTVPAPASAREFRAALNQYAK